MKHNLITSTLANWDLTDQRVVVRADLNVPLHHGTITNDYRLQAFRPTLDAIISRGGTPIILTHIGRPHDHDPDLSTRHLIPWFTDHGYTVQFAKSPEHAASLTVDPQSCILVENLRFFPGEKKRDPAFAQQLAACGSYFVQDAFATLHRNDTSMTLLAQQFTGDHKTIGLCVQQELAMLHRLVDNPARPFVVILGGGKVHDKIQLLEHMLDRIDTVMLCPAIVFTFLQAEGHDTGSSLVDTESFKRCRDFVATAREKNVKVLLPVDYHVAEKTIDGPLHYSNADEFTSHDIGISIGPRTIESWAPYIQNAGSIFYNSGMGFLSRPETLEGAHQLLERVAQSPAFTVIGGGESVAMAQRFHLNHRFDFVSTGGGATLAYLTGLTLPGLTAIAR